MHRTIALIALSLLLLTTAACEEVPEADLIFWGGAIYTANDKRPTAEVVAVKDGKIIFVGKVGPGRKYAGAETELIELKDKVLYPGFADAHVHLKGVGEREMSLDLAGTSTLWDMREAIENWVWKYPSAPLIVGRGWIETHWPEPVFPTRFEIDAVTGGKPALMIRGDGHALLANSAALTLAGIDRYSIAPMGGEILRFSNGEPTGMLIDNAMALVGDLRPKQDLNDTMFAFDRAFEVYASRGWVHAHNMSVGLDEVELLENLAQIGRNKLKIYNSVHYTDARGLIGTGESRSLDSTVRTRAIKLYVDGALGSRGAALLEPYSDYDSRGLVRMSEEEILPILELCLEHGIQVNTHAIGDRGNRLVLDWYEKAFSQVPREARRVAEPRWRIEHAQVLHPDDLDRFAGLGVIASMQPSHAISDLHFAGDRLGTDRLAGAYAWRSLIDRGVVIAGGSDAPVEVGDPLVEFYAAVARKDLSGYAGPDWNEEQSVTRQEALKMFTLWPAYGAFQEDETGSLEVGKAADFTILSADIMTIPDKDIPSVLPLMTMRDGVVAFERDDSGLVREMPLRQGAGQ